MAAKKEVFSAEEKAAMRELVKERKRGDKGDGLSDLLAKIAEMVPADRALAKKVHAIVTKTAPDLSPKTWYGFPAYANAEGKVVCFFQPAAKFKTRYATLGFSDQASLDDGGLWPTSYGLKKLTPADEKKIAALVKRAVSA
jgi:uncharacterized protein YdhG (YjbR/CyaY superfamily)